MCCEYKADIFDAWPIQSQLKKRKENKACCSEFGRIYSSQFFVSCVHE